VLLILMAACATATPTAAVSTPTVVRTLLSVPAETPTQIPTETPSRSPTVFLGTQSEGLQTYNGQGFSFQYPANARLENVTIRPPVTDEVHIIGSRVSVKPGDADWVYVGPGYEMIVRTYSNPEGLDAESWARNYVLTSWQEAKKRDEPRGSFPISEEGEIDEGQVGSSVVAGQPAFWVNYLAFDSYIRVFYLANNHQVVELSFSDYPLANQPLNLVQQDVYALIMGTFRFEGK